MTKAKIIFFLCLIFSTFFSLRGVMAGDNEEFIHLVLKDGTVVIQTRSDLAPKHVAQIKQLVNEGQYDGVVFHRVIEDFMAQTGDVEFGNSTKDSYNISRTGTGGSYLPNIKAEFSDANHGRGAVSMARSQNPDSANSQFFICFKNCSFLNGEYTVWGQVIKGMEFVDNIKLGTGSNGIVDQPDKIIQMKIIKK